MVGGAGVSSAGSGPRASSTSGSGTPGRLRAFEGDRRAFRRADYLSDAGLVTPGPGPLEQGVELVVAVGRVVMEQRKAAGARFLGHEYRVVDGAVAPVRLLVPLVVGVLGVVDQEVDPVCQLEHRLGHAVETGRRLVVADVGHAEPVPVDAVAVGRAEMGHKPRQDAGPADLELVVVDVVEADLA